MNAERSKDKRAFQACAGCVLMLVLLLIAPVIALKVWDWNTNRQVQRAESRARTAVNIAELLTMFGKPSYVYREHAPELGRDLVSDAGEIPEGQALYVFVITGMPPNFLVALVDDVSGKVLKIGLDNS
jgi:hypothetical protein